LLSFRPAFFCHAVFLLEGDHILQLYQHIVLSGGSTMYPGLPSR
jgi:hypothetical protein